MRSRPHRCVKRIKGRGGENEQIFFQLSHFVNHCSVNAGGYLFYYDERPLLKASFLSDILSKKLKVRLKKII